MTAIEEFYKTTKRIQEIFQAVDDAANVPARTERQYLSLQLESAGIYQRGDKALEIARSEAAMSIKALANVKRREADAALINIRREYSAELESLRAILPSLAAKASIEIGAVARELAS